MELQPLRHGLPAPPPPPAAGRVSAPPPFRSPLPPPILPRAGAVGVELSWRGPMVQVVRIIDVHTGEVLSQTPGEQVLAAVEHVMEQLQRKENQT
jgi:hypothetical protein